jgi:hypothetical protein
MALLTLFEAALPYFRFPEDFRAAISGLHWEEGHLDRLGMAHDVPVKRAVTLCHSDRDTMRSRTGLEAEAINRLTEGVQPAVMRAILVQCLAGEVAPSAAISRMLAEGGALAVRAAIDEVTLRAATVSRASDMLVHDRVDELTQVFVESVASVSDAGQSKESGPSEPGDFPKSPAPHRLEPGDQGETRISE